VIVFDQSSLRLFLSESLKSLMPPFIRSHNAVTSTCILCFSMLCLGPLTFSLNILLPYRLDLPIRLSFSNKEDCNYLILRDKLSSPTSRIIGPPPNITDPNRFSPKDIQRALRVARKFLNTLKYLARSSIGMIEGVARFLQKSRCPLWPPPTASPPSWCNATCQAFA